MVSAGESNAVVERLGCGVVTVVPLTTNIMHIYPFQVLVPASAGNGLSVDSKAQAEQIRALDCSCLLRRLGVLPVDLRSDLDRALATHLGECQINGGRAAGGFHFSR